MVNLKRPYHFKTFEDCLPQILLGPFLNTLTHTKRQLRVLQLRVETGTSHFPNTRLYGVIDDLFKINILFCFQFFCLLFIDWVILEYQINGQLTIAYCPLTVSWLYRVLLSLAQQRFCHQMLNNFQMKLLYSF